MASIKSHRRDSNPNEIKKRIRRKKEKMEIGRGHRNINQRSAR